ncbi:glycosyltransferase [uncultured Paenibacillus sp.]|uniref:glycosyltransferase n=1 Tax=uncultured Paenibacillus sp. TaxID=227322 RepID=UPI0015ADED76|nr:glycosyltransferase [uncultured Paenibacillus sp.]
MPDDLRNRVKLIIEIHFNDWGGTPDRLTQTWIENRLGLFMKYTRKSLQLQTSQDFSCYVLYDQGSERTIQEVLSRYAPLPKNIRFVTPKAYHALVAKDIAGYPRFYRVYLSSDDMYHKEFIRKLRTWTPKKDTLALVPQYGYIYDSVQDRLGKFFFWLPSYGATIHDVGKYLKGQEPKLSWRDVLKVPHEFIHVKEPIWINHIHALNTGMSFERASNWTIPGIKDAMDLEPWEDSRRSRAYFGPEIASPSEVKRVLSDFC